MSKILAALAFISLLHVSPAVAEEKSSVKERAAGFFGAVVEGDAANAMGFVLPYAHYRAMSTKPRPMDWYQKKMNRMVASLAQEFAEAKKKGQLPRLRDVVVDDVVAVSSGKLKRPAAVALITPKIQVSRASVADRKYYFIHSEGEWYFTFK